MKCNQTPVGPVHLNFPKETFSTLAELIRIIVDKKLYLLLLPWPPEDIKPTPPIVLPIILCSYTQVMVDQANQTNVETISGCTKFGAPFP